MALCTVLTLMTRGPVEFTFQRACLFYLFIPLVFALLSFFFNSLRPVFNLLIPWEKTAPLPVSNDALTVLFFLLVFAPCFTYWHLSILYCFLWVYFWKISIRSHKDQVKMCTYFCHLQPPAFSLVGRKKRESHNDTCMWSCAQRLTSSSKL